MKFLIRRFLFLLCVAALLTGCSGGFALARLDGLAGPGAIAWFSPAVSADREALARWRISVGPPFIRPSSSAIAKGSDEITVVSWNTALGAGDLPAFVRRLRREREGVPLILLLQEVYRRGVAIPRIDSGEARFASRLGGALPGRTPMDIESVAAALGMAAYYVPSMRNGGQDSDEDRGNAILSDLSLGDLTAIELPFEKQRRVAVGVTVAGRTAAGAPWKLRIVNVHLDNTVPRRAWLASEYGRARQARGLVAMLQDDMPTVLGGDFNTWFGFGDQAYIETAAAFPQTPRTDRRATFLGMLRLDHLFYRLPPGWRGDLRRAEHRFGSDHSPLIGTLYVR